MFVSPAWKQAQGGFEELLRHISPEEIPDDRDLLEPEAIEKAIAERGEAPYTFLAAGDTMLGERAEGPLTEFGDDYAFDAIRPLLRAAPCILANLEGPFAPADLKRPRNHSYAADPGRAAALVRAGLNVLNLANNHVTDCGEEGLRLTLETLGRAGVEVVGAGVDREAAHRGLIRVIDGMRVGFLGYYWHRRCRATSNRAGCAQDSPERLREDIRRVRSAADRVVVSFHWGVPYDREPLPGDREKARFAVECGADVVVGHHPHVLQPFEVHQGRPIWYSIGNFAFGTGNSRAEGGLLGIRFERDGRITADLHPIYVKNRDPRVNYRPRLLGGEAARRALTQMARLSGASADALHESGGTVNLRLRTGGEA